MINLTPTAEQQNAIDLVGRESRLKIQAYAGAAKSTTLAMIAHKYNVPSLYLTFNKVMADEAKKCSQSGSIVAQRTVWHMLLLADLLHIN